MANRVRVARTLQGFGDLTTAVIIPELNLKYLHLLTGFSPVTVSQTALPYFPFHELPRILYKALQNRSL